MKDMINNRYNRVKSRNKLHNFKSSFFERSPITRTIRGVKHPSVRDKYWFTVETDIWISHRPRKIRTGKGDWIEEKSLETAACNNLK